MSFVVGRRVVTCSVFVILTGVLPMQAFSGPSQPAACSEIACDQHIFDAEIVLRPCRLMKYVFSRGTE